MCKRVYQFIPWSRPSYTIAHHGPCSWHWRYWPGHAELRGYVFAPGRSRIERTKMLGPDEAKRMAKKVTLGTTEFPAITPLADAGEWREKFPLLMGYLCDPTYEDQTPRTAGRIFISAERGTWSIILKDPDAGIQLEVVVDKPTDMFPALEAALSSPTPPWRVDRWARTTVQRKKK